VFGSEFSARLIWGSSTTRCHTSVASFFIQFNNPLWRITLGVIRYPTLPSRSSYRTFTLVHYIRRDAPPSFTTSAYPGQYHLVGFSCAWARAYTSNSPYFWGTRCLLPRRLSPFISKKICVDSTTATALADSTRLLQNNPQPEQPIVKDFL
jgi:hypothetical protein